VSAATSLDAWGIRRADEVVELAAAAGLPLAVAATLLEKESGGGRNVWGADAVRGKGVLYRPGAEVTRADYERYRTELLAGRAGQQGVGPTQLTSRDYQAEADRLGGCWDWTANVTVGFSILAGHIARYGVRGGFVAYNGGPGGLSRGPTHPAQLYGDDAVRKIARWSDRLGAPTPSPTPRPPAAAPLEDDDMPTAAEIAEAVWGHAVTNSWGGRVAAVQILAATEGRTAGVHDQVAALTAEGALARRVDVGYARDQILAALGAPELLPADIAAGGTVLARLDELAAALRQAAVASGADPRALAAVVADELAARLRAPL
jgi:hypothetical protein